jgi:glycosyltransferase involved in cell wall biosynthesis
MRILVEAYACEPEAASEAGLGWHYPEEFARLGHDVTVITRLSMRERIEHAARSAPLPGLRFEFVDEPHWPLRFGWTVGSATQYVAWLWKASQAALRLDRNLPFDLLHHASYGSLLGGSFLWRVGRPVALGPVGGGQTAPKAFLSYFGRWKSSEVLRTLVVRRLWPLVWHARRAVSNAAVVLTTTPETTQLARRMGARCVVPMPNAGIAGSFAPTDMPRREDREELRVLWLGRFMPRKGLPLAVQALERLPSEAGVVLEVLGEGANAQNAAETRKYLSDHARPGRLVVHGPVPYEEIGEAFRRADAFIFTGLRDSGGGGVLQAMAYGLPVICLDHQGVVELVGHQAGIRVPVTTPGETVDGLAAAMLSLADSPSLRLELGRAGFARAKEHTWERKARQVLDAAGFA